MNKQTLKLKTTSISSTVNYLEMLTGTVLLPRRRKSNPYEFLCG
jgi:hypothetical protein